MMLTVLLGAVQLLGYSPADGVAVAFGEEREGSIVPAIFEVRRLTDEAAAALHGVPDTDFLIWLARRLADRDR